MNLLADLKALLQYHQRIGLGGYPKTGDLEKFLNYVPVPHDVPGDPGAEQLSQGVSSGERRNQGKKQQKIDVSEVETVLSDVVEEVGSCQACDLHQSRIYPVPGKGTSQIRLMIIGDWLRSEEGSNLPAGHLFGIEQDAMVTRMLRAINLPEKQVYITNIIKCGLPAGCQVQKDHVQRCISYLRRQIAVLQPEVICTMGMVVYRSLLDSPLPLSRLRGTFHPIKVGEDAEIPLLATYHPTFLLQNPEMKRATWEDLQLLARKMGLKISQ